MNRAFLWRSTAVFRLEEVRAGVGAWTLELLWSLAFGAWCLSIPCGGHHPAVGVVSNLAPGQFGQRLAGKQRNLHRREFDANADGGAAAGQVARNDEFVVAKTAVRG